MEATARAPDAGCIAVIVAAAIRLVSPESVSTRRNLLFSGLSLPSLSRQDQGDSVSGANGAWEKEPRVEEDEQSGSFLCSFVSVCDVDVDFFLSFTFSALDRSKKLDSTFPFLCPHSLSFFLALSSPPPTSHSAHCALSPLCKQKTRQKTNRESVKHKTWRR